MKGIVLLPEAWGVSRFDMHAELFDPRDGGDRSVDLPGNRILRLDDPRDAWQFSFPAVRPGIYAVTIDPLGWITDVDARGDGIEDAQLQVPPPARVSVRFTQEDSHIPADVQLIQWRYDPIHALSMKVNSLRPTSGTGWFEFVVPSGYIEISVEDDRFAPLVRSELASPRMKEIELPVVRACGFVLRIRNAGVQLPTSPEDVVVSGIDNPNMRTRVRAENLDQRFTVGGPGRYRIGLRPRKEYFPVRSQEIEIPPRRYVDVNFDLECAN